MAPFIELERGKINRGETILAHGVIFLNINGERGLVIKTKNGGAEVKTIDKKGIMKTVEKETIIVREKSVLIEHGEEKTLIEFIPNSDNIKKAA